MKLSELILDTVKNDDAVWNAEHLSAAITARLHDCVKPLEWGPEDHNGSFYASHEIGAHMTAFYSIEQEDYDLARVEFGVVCHEFGSETIWKGPKSEAKAAAQAHYAAQIIGGLDL